MWESTDATSWWCQVSVTRWVACRTWTKNIWTFCGAWWPNHGNKVNLIFYILILLLFSVYQHYWEVKKKKLSQQGLKVWLYWFSNANFCLNRRENEKLAQELSEVKQSYVQVCGEKEDSVKELYEKFKKVD